MPSISINLLRSAGLVVGLLGVASCTLLADPDSGRDVRVDVDHRVVQVVRSFETGDTVIHKPALAPADIPCLQPPRTCSITEYLQVTIANHGTRTVTRPGGLCPPPIERRVDGRWEELWPGVICAAILIPPVDIGPGEVDTFAVGLLPDWRSVTDEIRVVLRLHNGRGELPLRMRASPPFRLVGG